jgi:hypothetical protein
VKQDSFSRLEATVNAVVRSAVSVALEHGTPSISLRIEGEDRVMIIDTGSNISIVQPGISKSEVRHTDMRPYGVTGETLDVKGRQAVSFVLGGREFNHQFLVFSLPTDADGLLGMDFLKESGATVDLECNKMSLTDIGKMPRAKGTTLNTGAALTVFMEGKEGHRPQPTREEARCMDKQVPADSPRERTSNPVRAWLVKAKDNITMAPRSQQVVIGKLDLEQGQELPPLVCIELTHIPIEGVLLARALTRVECGPSKTARMTSRADQKAVRSRNTSAYVMLANFSDQTLIVP